MPDRETTLPVVLWFLKQQKVVYPKECFPADDIYLEVRTSPNDNSLKMLATQGHNGSIDHAVHYA